MTQPSDWVIKQWYANDSPLNLLVATGSTASPTLSVATTIVYWEKLIQSRNKLYTEDVGPLEFIVAIPYAISPSMYVTV